MSKKNKKTNLVLLDGKPDPKPKPKSETKPDKKLIRLLSKMLDAALKGDILSVSIVYETPDMVYHLCEGEALDTAEHFMALEKLKRDLIEKDEEKCLT